MKFGKTLAKYGSDYPRYKNYFISYKEIKIAIKNMKDVNVGSAESQLQDLLNRELEKINNFADLQAEALDGQLRALHRAISKPDVTEEQVDNVEATLDNLADEIVFLDFFVQVNFTGFRKITKKCDKRRGTSSSSWFMSRVLRERFMKQEPDKLLGFLALVYGEWREKCADLNRPLTISYSSEFDDERSGTAKFWMNTDQVTRAKVVILKYMNSVNDSDREIKARRSSQNVHGHVLMVPGIAKQQTHIYLDNASGTQYTERLRRRLGSAQAEGCILRCGWVGENTGEDKINVSVDGEDPTGSWSTNFKQGDMTGLLRGALPANKSGQLDLAARDTIAEQQLTPMIGVQYWRSAFATACKSTKITLEEDLRFYSEDSTGQPKLWVRSAGAVPDSETSFPYAVLSIKGKRPSWFSKVELLTLTEVHGFSKALHGTAVLQRPKGMSPPPWLKNLDVELGTEGGFPLEAALTPQVSPQKEFKATSSATSGAGPKSPLLVAADAIPAARTAPSLLARLKDLPSRLCRQAPPRLVIVDSKTMLANERTFLRWLRIAMLVLGMSSVLVGSASFSGKMNGFIIGGLSVVLSILPLFTFMRRHKLLLEKERIEYKDSTAPVLLGLSLLVMFVAVLVIDILYGEPSPSLYEQAKAEGYHVEASSVHEVVN